MHAKKIGVEWSGFMSKPVVVQHLRSHVNEYFLEPRGVMEDESLVDLLVATSNYLNLIDTAQERMKVRFAKIEWLAIELALAEGSDGKSAGPTIIDSINDEFSNNVEIRKLPVSLPKLSRKLDALSPFEKDAIVDAGRKFRKFPKKRLFNVLGHNKTSTSATGKFLN